jgi:hypothetical protein
VPDNTSQAHPRILYTPGEQVKLAESFYFLITKAVSLLLRTHNISGYTLSEQTRRAFATIVYELFKNTDDWARTSWNGSRVERSIRAIHIRVFSPNTLSNDYDVQLSKYLNRQRQTSAGFVEISILDSGPGYAQRKAKMSIDEIETLGKEFGYVHPRVQICVRLLKPYSIMQKMQRVRRALNFCWH